MCSGPQEIFREIPQFHLWQRVDIVLKVKHRPGDCTTWLCHTHLQALSFSVTRGCMLQQAYSGHS